MTFSSVGNLEITAHRDRVTLAMRNLVNGRPATVMCRREVRKLIANLEASITTAVRDEVDDEDLIG